SFRFQHAGQNSFGNCTKVLVGEFLPLRGCSTEKCSSGIDQIGTSEEEVSINQEVFLFRSSRCRYQGNVLLAEHLQNALSLSVQRFHRAEQRGLLVEGFACP